MRAERRVLDTAVRIGARPRPDRHPPAHPGRFRVTRNGARIVSDLVAAQRRPGLLRGSRGGDLPHGDACLWHEPVLGRLRRPHGVRAGSPTLFRHFIAQARDRAGSVYGRRLYEVMHYWDEDRPEWDAARRDFAAAWRRRPKWVVSRSSRSVGPNATLVADDLAAAIRGLKARLEGEIQVGGPELARGLAELGLIDQYRLYLHPVVLGRGRPFFAAPRPPLRLLASDRMDEDVIRLTYAPA